MNSPLISVCIPTYNRLDYLKLSVKSILAQTYHHYEICISQDPEPGGPFVPIQEWCEGIITQHPNIKYHLNKTNLGLSGNWNRLVELATGDYLIIIGDDDLLADTFLENMVAQIQLNSADVGFCDQFFINGTGEIEQELTESNSKTYFRDILKTGVIDRPVETVFNNSIPMSAALIKRNWLERFPFDPALNTPEIEIFLKIALQGGIFCYVVERLAYYRVHAVSATSSGLRVHRLLKNMIAIQVPAQYELAKQNFVAAQIVTGVNRFLKEGNKEGAKSLLRSKYYPVDKKIHKLVQTLLLVAPSFIVQLFYKFQK